MSFLPHLFGDSYFMRPSRILDQHFGLVLDPEDLIQPINFTSLVLPCPAGYIRSWKSSASDQDSGSTVTYGKDAFIANLDVQQFKPEEITVRLIDDTVVIEGKHEEKEDEHGQIFRHFVRKYSVPKKYDISKIESKLSSDGLLIISAPKIDDAKLESKNIPITQTGEPARPSEKKSDGDKKEIK